MGDEVRVHHGHDVLRVCVGPPVRKAQAGKGAIGECEGQRRRVLRLRGLDEARDGREMNARVDGYQRALAPFVSDRPDEEGRRVGFLGAASRSLDEMAWSAKGVLQRVRMRFAVALISSHGRVSWADHGGSHRA